VPALPRPERPRRRSARAEGSKSCNLTDAEWKYGSTDGEIFSIIANGVGGNSEMKGVRSELTTTDMWNIVNYLRSIGPQSSNESAGFRAEEKHARVRKANARIVGAR
jgi:mono/diheme cytochrome c family protein